MTAPKANKKFWEDWSIGPKELIYVVGLLWLLFKGYNEIVVTINTNTKDIAELKKWQTSQLKKDSTNTEYMKDFQQMNKELIIGIKELNNKMDEKSTIHNRTR